MNWSFVTDVLAVMGGGIIVFSVSGALARMWTLHQLKKTNIPIDPHVCIACLPVGAIQSLFDKLETNEDKYLLLCWINYYRPSIMAEQFVHEFAKTYPERFNARPNSK